MTDEPRAMTCRCGHAGGEPHPCHGKAYTCRAPAKQRFYAPHFVSLAGVQMKFEVSETWACDVCWAWFMERTGATNGEVETPK